MAVGCTTTGRSRTLLIASSCSTSCSCSCSNSATSAAAGRLEAPIKGSLARARRRLFARWFLSRTDLRLGSKRTCSSDELSARSVAPEEEEESPGTSAAAAEVHEAAVVPGVITSARTCARSRRADAARCWSMLNERLRMQQEGRQRSSAVKSWSFVDGMVEA